MKTLSDFVKSGSQKMTVDDLKLCIRQESYLEALSDLLSPLNPSIILNEIWSVPDAQPLLNWIFRGSLGPFLSLLNYKIIHLCQILTNVPLVVKAIVNFVLCCKLSYICFSLLKHEDSDCFPLILS